MGWVLAVTRWREPAAARAEQAWLQEQLELAPYDASVRLHTRIPVVLAEDLDAERGRAMLAELQGRGHGAVLCDMSLAPREETTAVVRDFVFERERFVGIDAERRRFPVGYGEIIGVFEAMETRDENVAVTRQKRQFSMRRAALTGGVMPWKKVEKDATRVLVEHERVAYLFRRSGPEPMLLRQDSLRYDGLGEYRPPTKIAGFQALLQWLCEYAPQAVHDGRMLTARRGTELRAVEGARKMRAVRSNEEANALAAWLLMHGYLQGQV
jgi:hypothetical protein